MSTQVILLEKIEKLGNMGDVVNVKPGFARNYLLPQSKALRATKDNIAYFETQKAVLEKANNEKKADAEKIAKKIEGTKIAIIRQASEGGQLYGSVTARDIAENVAESTKQKIERGMVTLNQNFKTIGLFPVPVTLHPEVKVDVIVNIARSADEAKIQEDTGKALIHGDQADAAEEQAAEADAREGLMEDEALEAAKTAEAEAEAKAADEAAKTEEKSAARAEKKAAKAEAEATDEEAENGGEIGAAPADTPEANAESEDEKT